MGHVSLRLLNLAITKLTPLGAAMAGAAYVTVAGMDLASYLHPTRSSLINMDKRHTIFPGNLAHTRFPVVPVKKAASLVGVLRGPPWASYRPVWTIGTAKKATVAHKKDVYDALFTVKARDNLSEQQMFAVQQGQLKHQNLALIHEVFTSETTLFLVSPYYSVTLETINSSPEFPSSVQLAVIAREVGPRGLHYMRHRSYKHVDASRDQIPRAAGLDSYKHKMFECAHLCQRKCGFE